MNDATPLSYAQSIAYLGCPHKIRNRTELYFGRGRAPDMRVIERILKRRQPRKVIGAGEPRDSDAIGYRRPSKAPPKPPEPPLAVRPAYAAPTPREVIAAAAEAFGLSPAELLSRTRVKRVCKAREVVAWVLQQRGSSTTRIGYHLGGRDHSTALNAIRNFEQNATPDMRELAERLLAVKG